MGGSPSGTCISARLIVIFSLTMTFATVPLMTSRADELEIDGAGFGHGVGMSQWGAKGLADAGKEADEILTFYYTGGAALGTLEEQLPSDHRLLVGKEPVWINVRESVTQISFEAVDGDLTICANGQGGCIYTASPGDSWSFTTLGDGTCQFLRNNEPVTDPDNCRAKIMDLDPEGAKVDLANAAFLPDLFARGTLKIRTPDNGVSLHALITLDLEDYLYGISEVFYSWPDAALEAQAIAARSFGVYHNLLRGPESNFSNTRKLQCWCHLFADTRSQNYEGWRNEIASLSENWIDAVDRTSGQVVVHVDSAFYDIAETVYSAANGGASENNEDVFGSSPLAFLRSVPDPWTLGAEGNTHSSWTFSSTEDEIATAYDVDRIDGLEIVEQFDSGTPSRIDIHTRDGLQKAVQSVTGAQLKLKLGLRGRHINTFTYGSIDTITGDFTGDNVPDVAMLLAFNDAWWVGDGSGRGFSSSPWANFGSHIGWQDPIAGDFTGDGRDDVAIYRETNGKWVVGTSQPSDRFSFRSWGSHPNTPENWIQANIGDFDGDGLLDISDYNPSIGKVRVFRSTGTTFKSKRWHTFAEPPTWASVIVGDFDGDLSDDIVFRAQEDGGTTILFSQGEKFEEVEWAQLDSADPLLVGDFTGDGVDDLAALHHDNGSWQVVASDPARTVSSVDEWGQTDPETMWSVPVVGDFNNDGRADIALLDMSTSKWTVLASTGTSFTTAIWGVSPQAALISEALTLDRDGDGNDDIAIWSEIRRKWWLASSDGESFTIKAQGRLLA